jgi:hypothetical protein
MQLLVNVYRETVLRADSKERLGEIWGVNTGCSIFGIFCFVIRSYLPPVHLLGVSGSDPS